MIRFLCPFLCCLHTGHGCRFYRLNLSLGFSFSCIDTSLSFRFYYLDASFQLYTNAICEFSLLVLHRKPLDIDDALPVRPHFAFFITLQRIVCTDSDPADK